MIASIEGPKHLRDFVEFWKLARQKEGTTFRVKGLQAERWSRGVRNSERECVDDLNEAQDRMLDGRPLYNDADRLLWNENWHFTEERLRLSAVEKVKKRYPPLPPIRLVGTGNNMVVYPLTGTHKRKHLEKMCRNFLLNSGGWFGPVHPVPLRWRSESGEGRLQKLADAIIEYRRDQILDSELAIPKGKDNEKRRGEWKQQNYWQGVSPEIYEELMILCKSDLEDMKHRVTNFDPDKYLKAQADRQQKELSMSGVYGCYLIEYENDSGQWKPFLEHTDADSLEQ